MAPEAVPDSNMAMGSVLPSSAAMMPPLDLVIIGSPGTPAPRNAACSEPI